jgi:hypothetical protein
MATPQAFESAVFKPLRAGLNIRRQHPHRALGTARTPNRQKLGIRFSDGGHRQNLTVAIGKKRTNFGSSVCSAADSKCRYLVKVLKKPQAFTHCGFRVRKLIVYERAPAPVRKAKSTPGLT